MPTLTWLLLEQEGNNMIRVNLNHIIAIVVFVLAALIITLVILFLAWTNTRIVYSCQELKNMHFKDLPAGCV